jgi:hypothetical protein
MSGTSRGGWSCAAYRFAEEPAGRILHDTEEFNNLRPLGIPVKFLCRTATVTTVGGSEVPPWRGGGSISLNISFHWFTVEEFK